MGYNPSRVQLPSFDLENRQIWHSLPQGTDHEDYLRRTREERRKREEPVLLPYNKTEYNTYAKKRMDAVKKYLLKNNPLKYKVQTSLLSWPNIPDRMVQVYIP